MVDKNTVQHVLGALMKHPQFLSESDKYNLTPNDFYFKFHKYLFVAIDSLHRNGVTSISPIDIENYLSTNDVAKLLFKNENGIEYLQDAISLSEEGTFPYYYKRLKKFNLLEAFNGKGIDTKEFFVEDPIDEKSLKINEKFESLEIEGIVNAIKIKLLGIEREYVQGDIVTVANICDGLENIIEEAESGVNLGIPLQGDIFNEVCAGARKGAYVVRSGVSGTGKTRQAVGDACFIAFPFRFEPDVGKWMQVGSGERTMFIVTEQQPKEIQTMILAYLTGMNETKFKYGGFSEEEKRIVRQALWVMQVFKDNFLLIRIPDPCIELVKTIIRENVLIHDIGYVFYDYIFVSNAILSEHRGFGLRNDEILLLLSTALKDLAAELNVFMLTSTQVNAKADDNQEIRNESSIAGSRAIINKADIGVIFARPTKEELEFFHSEGGISFTPTMVTDVFKVRAGEWNQVRIWSDVNLGNLRKKDLFVTNARMEVLNIGTGYSYVQNWEDDMTEEYREQLKVINEIE